MPRKLELRPDRQDVYRGYTITTTPYPRQRKDGSWHIRPEDAALQDGWRIVLTDMPLIPLEALRAHIDRLCELSETWPADKPLPAWPPL